jgi:hypothetical protein
MSQPKRSKPAASRNGQAAHLLFGELWTPTAPGRRVFLSPYIEFSSSEFQKGLLEEGNL